MSDLSAAAPLLPGLDQSQTRFVETLGKIYLTSESRWPNWQWIEETLEREGLDAAEILASLPRDQSRTYGYTNNSWMGKPRHDYRIGLTIAGLNTLSLADSLVKDFLSLVSSLGTIRSTIQLDPFDESQPVVNRNGVAAYIPPYLIVNKPLLELMRHEPATWHCELLYTSTENWTTTLPPELRRFAGVDSADDYFNRLREFLIPRTPVEQVPSYSPLTLPAAIDYFDVVWKLKFGAHLVVAPGVERSARLALDASSPEEVDSRLSAVSELLNGLKVSGQTDKGRNPLTQLSTFLKSKLPAETHARIDKAVKILQDVQKLRNSGQHYGASHDSVTAFGRLGLGYPVSDWSRTWGRIQKIVATAFDDLRDEIQASIEDKD